MDAGDNSTELMLAAGASVGPYQIEGPLGRGGMGQVYRARDTRLGRPVALKFLSDATVADAATIERFRREAQAISTLNHPNVCTVYDIGDHAGRPYLVMELLEGQTLKERIAERPFSNEEMLAVAIPILEALEAAHASGIVHRDIKPANIFLTRQGAVKILDFGLAKSAGAAPGKEESLTAPGTTVGTISYMSPEQARGQAVDARSDVFACGVVLYEMATGTLPFSGDGWAATVDAVLNRTPRPARELRRDLMPEIERVIERAIEKDPEARYQSAADMRADLLRARRLPSSTSVPSASPSRASRIIYAAAGAVVLLAIAGASWYFGIRKHAVTSPSEYVQLTDLTDSAVAPALSPDGRMVAFFRGGAAFLTTQQIYVKILPDGVATQLTNDPSPKYDPVFTPDGSHVAYSAIADDGSFNTWTVPVTGGASTRLMRNAAGLTWIGDGRILFSEVMSGTALHMGIVVAQESRAGEREIYFPDHERAMAHYSAISPDRKSILVVEMDGTTTWQRCRLLPIEGGPKEPVEGVQVGPMGGCLAAGWSPDGKWMYFNADVNGATHLWRQQSAGEAAEQITVGPGEEEGLAVVADSKSLISSVGVRKRSVWIHDALGERPVSLEGSATSPKVSADGRRVYYLLRKSASALNELWLTERASGKSDVALPGVDVIDFDISTDGQQVAFTAANGRKRGIFIAPLDGSAPPRAIAPSGDAVSFGAPGELVFRELGAQANYLARIKTDGTGLRRVLDRPIADKGAVSPDGAWAIFFHDRGDLRETSASLAISLKDGTQKVVCIEYCQPNWSSDGTLFYVTTNPASRSETITVALPVPRGEGLPALPPAGLSVAGDEEIKGVATIRVRGSLAPGPDPNTYAFARLEFVGNLFRIPLH